MCGIAGIYSISGRPVEPFDIMRLSDSQAHRGPNDGGCVLLAPQQRDDVRYYELTAQDLSHSLPDLQTRGLSSAASPAASRFRLALGHRRLAILDLTQSGHQPMANRARTVWITYNGEIYNYVELKKELTAKGYEFVSGTDTEVIVHLYEEFGPACIERLNGMFAFAIWDDRAQTLLLARDRYGIKPLYYTEVHGTLAFASEVKALLTLPGMPRAIDLPTLLDYFTFQNTFGESTLFRGIRLLEPGHTLTLHSTKVQRRRYWDFDFQPSEDGTEAQCRERLRFLLEDTVRRQLTSDVPVGAYLSGGMDSGSITALASAQVPRLMRWCSTRGISNGLFPVSSGPSRIFGSACVTPTTIRLGWPAGS
jgi:asparagine synthase (glutamine-hydrolysing)